MRVKWDDVARWQAKYDQRLLLLNSRTAKARSKILAKFLQATGKPRLSEIDGVDVQDYLVVFGRTHAPGSVRRVRGEIAAFWTWLIDVEGLDLIHVTRGSNEGRIRLRPFDAEKVLAELERGDYRVAQYMEGLLRREKRPVGITYNRLLTRWKRVVCAVGLPWLTMIGFRSELRRRAWGRQLIASWLTKRANNPAGLADYNLPWQQTHFRFTPLPPLHQ